MRRHGIEGEHLWCHAFRFDDARTQLLRDLGWTCEDAPPYVLNRAPLTDLPEPTLPEPALPAGYRIRSVSGPQEAAAITRIHTAAFGALWTPDLYRRYMQAPGYAAEREYVVVAPDDTFAAFTVTWHDNLNRIGLLEPVGTHPDHRRRGLGKAVVLHAMHHMKAAGMTHATVANSGSNEASRALYAACGFTPWHPIDDYVKPIPA